MATGCFAPERQLAAPSVGGRPLRQAVAAVSSGRSAVQRRSMAERRGLPRLAARQPPAAAADSQGLPTPRSGAKSRSAEVAAVASGRSAGQRQQRRAAPPGSPSASGSRSRLLRPPKASQPQGAKQRAALPSISNGNRRLCAKGATGSSVGWWEAAPPGSSSSGVRPLRRAVAKQRQPLQDRRAAAAARAASPGSSPASSSNRRLSRPPKLRERIKEPLCRAAAMATSCFAPERQPAAPSVGGRSLRRTVAAAASGRSAGQWQSPLPWHHHLTIHKFRQRSGTAMSSFTQAATVALSERGEMNDEGERRQGMGRQEVEGGNLSLPQGEAPPGEQG